MPSPYPSAGGSRREALPARLLPVLYFGSAHLFLAAAFSVIALDPRDVTGFFYHPRMVAVVHLMTLGWISLSILGAIYVISPMALRMPMPVRRWDYFAYALVTAGTLGMVSHFWLGEYGGMPWSAATVLVGLSHVAIRVLRGLRSAPIQPAVKLHLVFAFLNVLAAGGVGVLLAFDKRYPFLPAHGLSNVYAHAHLAGLGWASMMVIGTGYRLLPMVLPSAMPQGRGVYASAILLEAGVLGLFLAFLLRSALLPIFALIVVGGFAAFFIHVGWMRRHPRPAPAGLPRPDYGVRQAMQAMTYLALSAVLGVLLAFAPESEWTLKTAAAYGALGLVGFLAQMVVGMEARILPVFAAYHANLNACHTGPVVRPHEMPDRRIQAAVLTLWGAGVPALACGLFFEMVPLVATAGWLLLTAAALGGFNTFLVLRHAFRKPRKLPASETPRGARLGA